MDQKESREILHKLAFDKKNRLNIFLKFPEEKQAYLLRQLLKNVRLTLILA